MAGDGVSMPTNLAQLGSVAKTQAQAQQAAQPATSVSEELAKKDSLKAQRVKEIQKSDKGHINPDEDRRQKRKKRRLEKSLNRDLADGENQEVASLSEEEEEAEEELGLLVDLRA